MAEIVRNQLIRTWQSGDQVQGFALLSRKEVRSDRNNRTYLDLELTDVSGSIAGKVWADSPALQGEYEAHDFVAFKGSVKLYRDQLQISLDDCRRAVDEDRRFGFDEGKLTPSTKEDIGALYSRLEEIVSEIRRPVLRRLAEETLEVHGEALREHPAAKSIHHAYRGGLLEHVVSMGELALLVSGHYRELDRDLMLLGVLFHDLGKIRELGAMPANDYTLEGRMVGHVVIGRDLVRERAAAIPDFPEDLLLHLEHLVLSHQGRREFASPVEPMTPEAFALHAIDDLDSKLAQLRDAEEQARTQGAGAELVWLRPLGRHVHVRPDRPQGPGEPDGKIEPEATAEPAESAAPAPEEGEAGARPTEPSPAASPPREQGSARADAPAAEKTGAPRGLFD